MVVKSHGNLHKVHEKDQQTQANLRAAQKLTATVLLPDTYKQNVPAALAVFDPSTVAAIQPRKSRLTWISLHRICVVPLNLSLILFCSMVVS